MKILKVGNLTLNDEGWEVLIGKKEISLSFTEFLILKKLMENVGKVLNRKEIIKAVKNGFKKFAKDKKTKDYAEDSNVIDVYMSFLRKKIDGNKKTKLIHSVRHIGYKIKAKRT